MAASLRQLSVLQAKRFGIYSCRAEETLLDAANQLTSRNISSLVVVDADGALEGIITRTDLVRACYQQTDWAKQHVGDYMSRQVVTVTADEPLDTVMQLLIDRHIHRVVVIQEGVATDGKEYQRPIAVLSAADIVYHMMQFT